MVLLYMHISQLHRQIERGEFALRFVSERGELVQIDRCVLTSWHTMGNTFNVLITTSEQTRTINKYTILSVNGQELYL